MNKIQSYINWFYIILLIFPVFWLILAPIWYYSTIETIDGLPLLLFSNESSSIDFMEIGSLAFIGFFFRL